MGRWGRLGRGRGGGWDHDVGTHGFHHFWDDGGFGGAGDEEMDPELASSLEDDRLDDAARLLLWQKNGTTPKWKWGL